MPPDKALLEELKEMSDDEHAIPTKQMNRLILAGMVELHEKLAELKSSQEQCASMITEAMKPIKKNPMFAIGDFINNHPKASVGIFVVMLVLSNIWFLDEVRYGVLVWLKVPKEIINLLVHGG